MSVQCKYREITFTDADVVNIDNWIPKGEYNPHNVRPWLLHDHGFVLCVVFAESLQEALDEAADENKLDRYQIYPEQDKGDYLTSNWDEADHSLDPECPEWVDTPSGVKYWWRDGMVPAFLGNAGEPFDIDTLEFIGLPNPSRSFCAQFAASVDKQRTPQERLFSVIEYSSFFAVRHNPTGEEHPMGDGVDTLFDEDMHALTPGTDGFVETWEESLNSDTQETLEAYFPHLAED
jgi:hypothetical protein